VASVELGQVSLQASILHTLHLHAGLIKRTNGRNSGTFQNAGAHWIEKYFRLVFEGF